MICIFCSEDTKVVNSRPSKRLPSIWRRRKCPRCNVLFSTHEYCDLSLSIKVTDEQGSSQPFSEDKLFVSLHKCFSHREDALKSSRELLGTVLSKLTPAKFGIIQKKKIARTSYNILYRFDRVAAVYYKSHHRSSK